MNTKGNQAYNRRSEFQGKYRYQVPSTNQEPKVINLEEYRRQQKLKYYNRPRKQIKAKSHKKKFKLTGKRVATLLLGIGIFLGGRTAMDQYSQYQEQNAPISLEQALEIGETPNSLEIDNNIPLQLQEIQKVLEKEDVTNQELIALAPKINSTYFDIVEEKIANSLKVDQNRISLKTVPAEEGTTRESVIVRNGDIYTNNYLFKGRNSISNEIADAIKDIKKMQKIMQDMQQGNFDRNDIIEKYRSIVKGSSQFAASKVQVDEKGNISLKQTKVSDLNQKSKQVKNSTLDQEPEIG